MSEPPDKKPKDPGSTDRTDNQPSVRSVAVAAGAVVATVGGIAVVALGGWIALAVAGAATATGGVVVARVRNPRQRRTRPGLVHTLLGRPRRPARSTGRTGLPWPLTGSQSRRGKAKPAGAGTGMKSGGKSRGIPKLPALTAKGRAKRATQQRLAGPHAPARKATAPRAAIRPGGKPAGTNRPGTSSRTPGRAGAARKLTTSPGKAKAPTATTGRRTGTGVATAKRATTRPSTGRRAATAPARRLSKTGVARPTTRTGVRPATGGRPVRRTKPTTTRRNGTGVRPRPTTRGMGGPGRRPTVTRRPGTRTPKIGTVPTIRRTSLNRGGKPATTRARRIGTQPTTRRATRTPGKATPNRTAARPQPFAKRPTRQLVGTAMRLPRRNGMKITRPSPVQVRKARRHLVLRSRVAGRRGLVATAKAPVTVPRAMFRRRPGWLWPVAPSLPDPRWTIPTVPEPKAKTQPAPKKTAPASPKRHRTPEPVLTGRRAVPTTTTTSKGSTMTAADAVADAFSSVANFQPQSAKEMEAFLAQQVQVVQSIGAAYRALAQRATSEMPYAAPVADAIADLGAGFVGLESLAANLPAMIRAAHPEQWAAIENPLPGQEQWDTHRNR